MRIKLYIKNKLQNIVDALQGRIADIITTFLYFVTLVALIISVNNIVTLTTNPIPKPGNANINGLLIIICLLTFYISMLGEYYKQPHKRLLQYIVLTISISIFSLNYLSSTFNGLYIGILSQINNIEVIPPDLLIGNIRVATILVPAIITIPLASMCFSILGNENSKNKLREYEVEMLLPTVHKMDDTTIDIEICKDLKTGMPCIVPEKILYEHTWLQGGTGSGKTSNYILPYLEQLLSKKAYLTYRLKEKSMYCLDNNIAAITKPISNYWYNQNFDLSLIQPLDKKENELHEVFGEYLLGSIKSNELVYENVVSESSEFILKGIRNSESKYIIKISTQKGDMLFYEDEIEITKGREILNNEFNTFTMKSSILGINDNSVGVYINNTQSSINEEVLSDNIDIKYSIEEDVSSIKLNLLAKENNYTYKIRVFLKGTGRLVPKNLGLTLVAPDGELVSETVKLAKEYGVNIHKIDPFMEEIRTGEIAVFNPLIGESPEKIGDIVASILVNMDIGSSSKSNPYFINASVRAVRNIVILLKISYPELFNREPTLVDVLACLNDFSKVEDPVKYVKDKRPLYNRWSSVIQYFETHFMEPPTDHNDNKARSYIGSQTNETKKAISGIINQLDNLLSREEIRYILANTEKKSINITEVLRKGECIAISTRQGNLGERLGRAFALFFILTLQNEVLNRYAEKENPEVPHHIIIDEFPMYCNENTETFFSFARKYKAAVTIAIQNMGQLKKISDEFGETLFTNTTTKLLLPKSNSEDRKYWSDFFGNTKDLQIMTGITTSSIYADNPSYSESMRGSLQDARNVSEQDIDELNFQQLYYHYTNHKGRKTVGKGTTTFLEKQVKPYMHKQFDFEKHSLSIEEYHKMKETEKIIEKKIDNNIKEQEINSNTNIPNSNLFTSVVTQELQKDIEIKAEQNEELQEVYDNITTNNDVDIDHINNKLLLTENDYDKEKNETNKEVGDKPLPLFTQASRIASVKEEKIEFHLSED